MRTAVIQIGPGHPPLERQLARLEALSPERYHVEETMTARSAQRILECLERQAEGDEVCFLSLATLRLGVGETVRLLKALTDRGVACLTLDDDDQVVRVDGQAEAGPVLHLLSDLQARLDGDGAASPARPPEGARGLLGEAEIADIRRLARSGLSPRRIGLIYRRTPDCI
ncbi:MAG TPA: hypothetical protein PLO65_03815, partial [Caulobacter sp.]|nr:hypothetical protein [Caulobacter sp.]